MIVNERIHPSPSSFKTENVNPLIHIHIPVIRDLPNFHLLFVAKLTKLSYGRNMFKNFTQGEKSLN